MVKFVSSAGTTCNAANINAADLVGGMQTWSTTIHALPSSPVTYGVTELFPPEPRKIAAAACAAPGCLTDAAGNCTCDQTGNQACQSLPGCSPVPNQSYCSCDPTVLSVAELNRLTGFCGFLQANGSGFGICRRCHLGGQGAVKQ